MNEPKHTNHAPWLREASCPLRRAKSMAAASVPSAPSPFSWVGNPREPVHRPRRMTRVCGQETARAMDRMALVRELSSLETDTVALRGPRWQSSHLVAGRGRSRHRLQRPGRPWNAHHVEHNVVKVLSPWTVNCPFRTHSPLARAMSADHAAALGRTWSYSRCDR